jgi:hypothetical protein
MSKKESAIDISKYVDKGVRVKLAGGREGAAPACIDPDLDGGSTLADPRTRLAAWWGGQAVG